MNKKVSADNMDDKIRVERMKFISMLYQQWIKHKKQNSDIVSVGIYDIIDNAFGDYYDIKRFLDDYRFITQQQRDMLPYDDDDMGATNDEEKVGSDLLTCDIDSCYIMKRTERNKAEMTRFNHKRNEMFFIKNNGIDGDGKDIAIQNILDSLHVFIYHTLRIDYTKYIGTEEPEEEEVDFADDSIIISCFDEGVKKLGEVIKKKQQNSIRYRSTSNRYTNKNNKFVTTNASQYDNDYEDIKQNEESDISEEIAVFQSIVYGNDQLLHEQKKQKQKQTQHVHDNLCFTDHLYAAINENKSKLKQQIVEKFKAFLVDNDYETDSICDDINNDPQSNIMTIINNNQENDVLGSILNKFVYIHSTHSTVYHAGYRYFYWDYYQNIDTEWIILYESSDGRPRPEGNSGYNIKDWYIPRKYKNLKHELLQNEIGIFSLQQFNNIKQESTMKLTSWMNDPDSRPLKSQMNFRYPWAERCYGIAQGTDISVEHIMCLLFYTNFSANSALFSRTFRRENAFETDESLKARNREFWHWSKFLRECVECFGLMFEEVHEGLQMVWHGVAAELIFDSTFIKLCGPLSTTAGLFVCFPLLFSFFLLIIPSDTRCKKTYTQKKKRFYHSVYGVWR